MTELPENTSPLFSSPAAQHAAQLLQYYSFELGDCCIEHVLKDWLDRFPEQWVPLAIIEALYQGRYKTVSVEQILTIWQRREQTICHFNHEFERLVSGKFPRVAPLPEVVPMAEPEPKLTLSYRKMLLELPSVRAASKLERLTEIPSLKLALYRPELELLEPNGASDRHQTPDRSSTSDRNPATNISSSAVPAAEPAAFKPSPRTVDAISAGTSANSSSNGNLNGNRNGHSGCHSSNGSHSDATSVPAGAIVPDPIALDREFKEFKEGVAFGLSYGLVARSLKPKFRLEFSQHYQPEWVNIFPTPTSIDQFIPTANSSEFHTKLKTVAQSYEQG